MPALGCIGHAPVWTRRSLCLKNLGIAPVVRFWLRTLNRRLREEWRSARNYQGRKIMKNDVWDQIASISESEEAARHSVHRYQYILKFLHQPTDRYNFCKSRWWQLILHVCHSRVSGSLKLKPSTLLGSNIDYTGSAIPKIVRELCNIWCSGMNGKITIVHGWSLSFDSFEIN